MNHENISYASFPRVGRVVRLGDWHKPMWEYLAHVDSNSYEAREQLDFVCQDSNLLCIALAGGYMIVGYGRLAGGILASASVHEDFRRRGIYKDLVKLRMEYAINVLRVKEITVGPTRMTAAYFRSLGFTITKNGPDLLGVFKVDK